MVTKKQLDEVIEKLETKASRLFLYVVDAEVYDEEARFTYKLAGKLLALGYDATLVHQKEGFR